MTYEVVEADLFSARESRVASEQRVQKGAETPKKFSWKQTALPQRFEVAKSCELKFYYPLSAEGKGLMLFVGNGEKLLLQQKLQLVKGENSLEPA